MFTAANKQLIMSLRQLKGYSSRRFLKEFSQKNGHAEDLIASSRILTNMGLRKEFQAVGDRAVHARLITLLQWKNLCRAKRISWRHTVRFVRQQEILASIVPATDLQ